jgi:carboxypeptidase Q
MRRVIAAVILVAVAAPPLCGQTAADSSFVERVRREATERSQVMEYTFTLAEVYGPRLTGSPGFKAAGDWAAARLRAIGLQRVMQQRIDWGRGWSSSHFAVEMLAPYQASLIGAAGPWSASTRGRVGAEPFLAPAPTDVTEDSYGRYVQQYRGRLKGKMVLLSPPHAIQPPPATTPARRFTDEELARLARTEPPAASPALPDSLFEQFRIWGRRLNRFFLDEGVVALIHQSRGDGGMVVSFGPDWARGNDTTLPPTAFLAAEHYMRVVRLLEKNVPVRLSVDLEARVHEDPSAAFNVIAELPGSTRKDEVVMLGAHLDSWAGGTGATDDAAGCAIVLEAMRILTALGVRPARTIRVALWGGHEGAGIGSLAYVSDHLGLRTSPPHPPRDTLVAYFNLDNGGGKIRGLYLPLRDEHLRALFESWLAPLAGLGAATVVPIREPSGSDHATFYRAGVPAFMFVQDPLEYRTRTRHSNMDVSDYLQPEDMQQAAAVVAAFIYQAAMSGEWPRPAAASR